MNAERKQFIKEKLNLKDIDFKAMNGRIVCQKTSLNNLENTLIEMPAQGITDAKGNQLISLDEANGYPRFVVLDIAPDVKEIFAKFEKDGHKPLQYGDTVMLSDNMIFIFIKRGLDEYLIIHYMDILSYVPFDEDRHLKHLQS